MHRSPIEVLKVPSLELALGIYDIDKDSNSARPAIEVVEVFGYNHSLFVQPTITPASCANCDTGQRVSDVCRESPCGVTKENAFFDMTKTKSADGTVTGTFAAVLVRQDVILITIIVSCKF